MLKARMGEKFFSPSSVVLVAFLPFTGIKKKEDARNTEGQLIGRFKLRKIP